MDRTLLIKISEYLGKHGSLPKSNNRGIPSDLIDPINSIKEEQNLQFTEIVNDSIEYLDKLIESNNSHIKKLITLIEVNKANISRMERIKDKAEKNNLFPLFLEVGLLDEQDIPEEFNN